MFTPQLLWLMVQKMRVDHQLPQSPETVIEADPMDELLAQLSEQQKVSFHQGIGTSYTLDLANQVPHLAIESQENINPLSLPTPASEDGNSAGAAVNLDTTNATDPPADSDEVLALKTELARAQRHINLLGNELAHQLAPKTDIESADRRASIASASMSGHAGSAARVPPPTYNPHGISPQPRAPFGREHAWGIPGQEDIPPEVVAESVSTNALGFSRAKGIWNNTRSTFGTSFSPANLTPVDDFHPAPWGTNNRVAQQPASSYGAPSSYDAPAPGYFLRPDRSGAKNNVARPSHRRSNRFDNPSRHGNSTFNNGYNGFDMPTNYQHSRYDAVPTSASPGGLLVPGYPRSTGYSATTLSPHAAEFTSAATGVPQWKNDVSQTTIRQMSLQC